jgi:hypothetical protein
VEVGSQPAEDYIFFYTNGYTQNQKHGQAVVACFKSLYQHSTQGSEKRNIQMPG